MRSPTTGIVMISASRRSCSSKRAVLNAGGDEGVSVGVSCGVRWRPAMRPWRTVSTRARALRLQRIDSDMAAFVAKKATREGIVALPVHDEFIAPKGRAIDRVKELMMEAFDRFATSHSLAS
jgi:hypothetical protein